MSDTGRQHDIAELYRMLSRELNPERKYWIKKTIEAINKESGLIRSMRESLIKAHRDGNKWEIKDIHDFIKNKRKYINNY